MLLGTAILAACSKDTTAPAGTDPGTGTIVNMKGTFSNTTLSGDIDINFAATATLMAGNEAMPSVVSGAMGSVAITGCLYLKTATCTTVTGTYDTGTKVLTFSSVSPALTFTGTYASGDIQGTFTGSGGSGFWAVKTGTVAVYCGQFLGSATGRWNFILSGTSLEGVYNDGSGNNRLTGTKSPVDSLFITFSGGAAIGVLTGAGASANGTWTAGTASGTWVSTNTGCRS